VLPEYCFAQHKSPAKPSVAQGWKKWVIFLLPCQLERWNTIGATRQSLRKYFSSQQGHDRRTSSISRSGPKCEIRKSVGRTFVLDFTANAGMCTATTCEIQSRGNPSGSIFKLFRSRMNAVGRMEEGILKLWEILEPWKTRKTMWHRGVVMQDDKRECLDNDDFRGMYHVCLLHYTNVGTCKQSLNRSIDLAYVKWKKSKKKGKSSFLQDCRTSDEVPLLLLADHSSLTIKILPIIVKSLSFFSGLDYGKFIQSESRKLFF
jgi:hypothetical protein